MALRVDLTLVSGMYDAADGQDPRRGEWPPHPARLFCALTSVAESEGDWDALRNLESLGPPTVLACDKASLQSRSGYVVTNRVEKKGGNLTHPGRTSGLRQRVAAMPDRPDVAMVWPDQASDELLEAVDRLASRVPYLGRSTSIALVSARLEAADESITPGLEVLVPCGREEAESWLRVPYPGYLTELQDLYQAGQPAWVASPDSRAQGYRVRRSTAAPEEAAPSAYTDLVILRFTGLSPDGRLTTRFTDALRRRVMATAPDPLPAALHGHDHPGRPHVAFLALPQVGDEHADGHLMGLAVAIPALPQEERRAILLGTLPARPGEPLRLRVPDIGEVELTYEPGRFRPWGMQPERWRRGSNRWVSATPMVLDRYPKRGDVASVIARSCVTAGFPEPVAVDFSTHPLTKGAVQMRPRDLPETAHGRLFRHVALTFPSMVAGPVLIGAGRYLGSGLFSPQESV